MVAAVPRLRQRIPSVLKEALLGRLFAAVLVLLTAGAIYTSVLVAKQQNEPSGASRYNLTWLVSQAGVQAVSFADGGRRDGTFGRGRGNGRAAPIRYSAELRQDPRYRRCAGILPQ